MCTAITYKTKDFYFGRTLDYDFSYNEEITITPRSYPLPFRNAQTIYNHYAFIGMAYVQQNYPLYYDAVNEKGVGIAGLNFVGSAVYQPPAPDADNIAQFELIPWILGQCESVYQAKELLTRIRITDTPFSQNLPTAQLHWIIADRNESITVEAVRDGLKIYSNPVGILTNNPSFDIQLHSLNNYMQLSAEDPRNNFCNNLPLHVYSHGMGAMGLPGDMSSQSRFIRATFTKMNAVSDCSEKESISQFFHIADSVQQSRGCCKVGKKYEITIYTCCCNADKGIYYYTTYNNRRITAVDMHREALDSEQLIRYPMLTTPSISEQN